jgi:hypothetical protein
VVNCQDGVSKPEVVFLLCVLRLRSDFSTKTGQLIDSIHPVPFDFQDGVREPKVVSFCRNGVGRSHIVFSYCLWLIAKTAASARSTSLVLLRS